MSEDKQQRPEPTKPQDVPAHSTAKERERLKDFNKDGIPPGSC